MRGTAQRVGWLLGLGLVVLVGGTAWVRANQEPTQDPLARAFDPAMPNVQTCLRDAELNPRGLRLSERQCIELQARIDSANLSYYQLRDQQRSEKRAQQRLEFDARCRAVLEDTRRLVSEHLALHGTR